MKIKNLPEFWAKWQWIRQITSNPNHPSYPKYGGKGIGCHWGPRQYKEFEHWILTTLGPKPSSQHCLSRKNKSLDYCPSNLEWALPKQRSRSHTHQNIFVKYRNHSKSIAAWAEELDIPYYSLRRRIQRGIPIKDIVKEFRNA